MCLTYRSFCIGTLVILRLVLTTPGLSRQGSSKVGHRTSHLAALRVFVSRSQNTKISWYIVAHYPKIHQNTVCQVHHGISVHSHAMNLTEFHGTFGKTNWEKLGKIAVLKSSEVAPVPGPSPLLAGDFATLQRLLSDSVGSDARGPPGVSKISESRWDHGQLIDAQSNTLKNIENTQWRSIESIESMNNVQICAIHRATYITKDASNTILTARAATSARNWACQVKESHGFSTLHIPILSMAHGPWPIPEQDITGLWRTTKSLKFHEIPWILAMWIVSWRPFS